MALIQEAPPAPPQVPKHVPKPASPPRAKPVVTDRQSFSQSPNSPKPRVNVSSPPTEDPLATAPAQSLDSKQKAQAGDPSPKSTMAPASPPEQKLVPAEQAQAIDWTLIPAWLANALGLNDFFDGKGFRSYLDEIRRKSGDPVDPFEIMLVEQLAMMHLRAAQLQAEAGLAKSLEAIRVFNSASARLFAEFRMTVLALKAYRSSHQKTDPPASIAGPADRPNATADK